MIMTNLKKKPLILLVGILVLTAVSCRLIPASISESPAVQEDFTDQTINEVETLLEDIQQQSGTFAFTITEEEMASYLNLKISENQAQPQVEDLDVEFQNNEIKLSGDVLVQNLGIKVPAELILAAKVDEIGQLYFEFISVSVGNMDLPASMEESISTTVTEVMNSKFANYLSGFKIETVYVDAGMLTISGVKR